MDRSKPKRQGLRNPLAQILSAGGPAAFIGYSPYCVPRFVGGVKGVVVNPKLRDLEPMAWDFVMNFARDNKHGGAWMGFHFAGFALTPSDVPANWDWYHNTFLGSGSYASNTWRPTSAILRVEDRARRSSP